MNRSLTILIIMALAFSTKAQELDRTIEPAHPDGVHAVAVSADESTILSGGEDKRAYLWTLQDGTKQKALSHGSAVTALAYNNNNSLFVSASADSRLIVFDAATAKPKKLLKGHSSAVNATVFHPLNDMVATADAEGNVKLWNEDGSLKTTLKGHSKSVHALAFSPDGATLVSGGDDGVIRYWSTENGQPLSKANSDSKSIQTLAFSNDGNFLASGGSAEGIELWNPVSGAKITKLVGHQNDVLTLDFSSDVQYLASGSLDGTLIVWNLSTMQPVKTLEAHQKGVRTLDFSQEGGYLVTGGGDGLIKIWRTAGLDIGKRRFAKSNASPNLSLESLSVIEANDNGLVEYTDNPSLSFEVKNTGKGQAYNLMAKVRLSDQIAGLTVQSDVIIGNLDKGSSRKISIPLAVDQNLESGTTRITLEVSDANGNTAGPKDIQIQTKGESHYAYLMVKDVSFSSANGKAEPNTPITLKVLMQNTSKGTAKNVTVKVLLPAHVMAVDKLKNIIPEIPAEGLAEATFEFYATEEFNSESLKPQVIIQGAFSNIEDQDFAVAMNESLPVNEDYGAIAMAMNIDGSGDEIVYRGGGDPLQGLNVAKAKEMVLGKYYALIIGVDNYSGTWTPLNNAVRDAKAVENMLRSKYKFDEFKTLYNEQATRANIIQAMEWLVSNVKEEDNLFIYYSGHGEYKEALNKGYWVPIDAKSKSTSEYISNSDIQTFIGGIRSRHTLLVSDACFSGDIFRGNTVSIPFEDNQKYYTNIHNLVSRKAITSGGIEPVMDGGRDGHSVFAYYFLKTLNGHDGKYLDAGKLYEQLKVPVINNSEQTPQMAPVKNTGDEGGQFIFVKK